MAEITCPECSGVGRIVLKGPSVGEVVFCPLCEATGWVETKAQPAPPVHHPGKRSG